jgi:hypothetical protein
MPDRYSANLKPVTWCRRCQDRMAANGVCCTQCVPPTPGYRVVVCPCGRETANAGGVCTRCIAARDCEQAARKAGE